MDQPTKSFNTRGGKNRLRFASAKFRAKQASADVYRSSDNRRTASSTGLREKRVHDTSFRSSDGVGSKRRRRDKGGKQIVDDVRYFGNDKDAEGFGGIGRTAVIVSSKSKLHPVEETDPLATTRDGQTIDDATIVYDEVDEVDEEEKTSALITGGTIFLSELEISAQRNGSQLYQKLVRELRSLCKSLAELLHHRERIIDFLFAYMLSPRDLDGNINVDSPTPPRLLNNESWKSYRNRLSDKVAPYGYSVNAATNEVLHLLGVLARELRTELYPYLTTRILPRIVDDMLNPPIVSAADSPDKSLTFIPVDVSHIEAAFRTVSYLFKYNSEKLIHSHVPSQKSEDEDPSTGGDADILRHFYGKTICHKRDIVRRLACEAYAPLLRKCSEKGLKRHLSRTVKALAGSLAAASVIENETINHSTKRARDDAIDGVSFLLFEVSRGAPGRLHSTKGRLVAKTIMDSFVSYGKLNTTTSDLHRLALETNKAYAVREVASQFLYKVRGHVARKSQEDGHDMAGNAFADVLDELHRALDLTVSMMKSIEPSATITDCASRHIIDLMTETITFQDGRLLHNKYDRSVAADRIAASLQELLSNNIYSNAGHELQESILRYLCSAWRTNPSHSSFAYRLGKFFPSIMSKLCVDAESHETGLDPALFLGQNLLPYLPKKVASTYLIPALLGAAASSGEKVGNSSLVLLHTISTSVWPRITDSESANEVDIDDTAAEALFTWEAAEHCPEIPSKVRLSLFDICLTSDLESILSTKGKKKSQVDQTSISNQLARVGYISRCIPFLICLECSGNVEDSEEEDSRVDGLHYSEEVLNRVFNWYLSTLSCLNTNLEHKRSKHEWFITQSLILESLSKSIIECHRSVSSSKVSSMMNRTLDKAKTYASSLLFYQPKSIWVVRGVAAVTSALSSIDPGSYLNDRSNEVFELMIPNLAQPNHFLRLSTLQLLDSYPTRPFVTDHADLDLTDDLDEEPSYRPLSDEGERSNVDNSSSSLLSGTCDVISLLKILELIPVALPNERNITSQLSRIEVYARTGKLPIVYAEAITCHMLGLLHVKFAPIWAAVAKVIVSIASAQEGPVWPFIERALNQTMERSSVDNVHKDQAISSPGEDPIIHHHRLCVEWELSKGKKNDIFRPSGEERNAQVSRHAVTDELTLFENIWSILEKTPQLTSTKSKAVVPIFFEFLVNQYFVFHQDEPDSREIELNDVAIR